MWVTKKPYVSNKETRKPQTNHTSVTKKAAVRKKEKKENHKTKQPHKTKNQTNLKKNQKQTKKSHTNHNKPTHTKKKTQSQKTKKQNQNKCKVSQYPDFGEQIRLNCNILKTIPYYHFLSTYSLQKPKFQCHCKNHVLH